MSLDAATVNRWIDEYLEAFGACTRGDRDMSVLLSRYGVPLIITTDDGVITLMTDDEAAAVMQSLVDGLRANGYDHTDVLHSEVSVLNKINAANVLTLRTVQDSNKLLASLLEQQTILAKQQREATTNAINADISRRANLSGNMSQVTSTLTDSLQNFRMP